MLTFAIRLLTATRRRDEDAPYVPPPFVRLCRSEDGPPGGGKYTAGTSSMQHMDPAIFPVKTPTFVMGLDAPLNGRTATVCSPLQARGRAARRRNIYGRDVLDAARGPS